MARLRGSKILVDEMAHIMRRIDRENKGTSSFTNYSVGIANFLHDKGFRLRHYADLEELKYVEK